MEDFATYILEETSLSQKMLITYYLSKKTGIFFDKSIVLKTEIVKMFIDYMQINVDKNLVLTAMLLCNCKKIENAQKIGKLETFAKEGAEYLSTLGFSKRFCKICEEVNRDSGSNPRERESDVLELVDQFGGMLLDRPERIGFEPDEAIVLLKYRNLKDKYNRYSEIFIDFINMLESIDMGEFSEVKALKRLRKLYNENSELIDFIKKVVNQYEPQVDSLIDKKYKKIKNEMFEGSFKNNRPLFTEETTVRILKEIEENNLNFRNKQEENI